MKTPSLSILISSYKRQDALRRTLYAVNKQLQGFDFEVILSEEHNPESHKTLEELAKYSFPYTYVLSDVIELEQKTGRKKYYNNPALTYNIGLLRCSNDIVGVLGNDTIITDNCVPQLLEDAKRLDCEDYIVYTTTYNCQKEILAVIGEYGENLRYEHILKSASHIMQSKAYRTIVNNYFSITPRSTMLKINGWDENYLFSICAEDSCVSRRIFAIPGSKSVVSDAISLHQAHDSAQFDKDKKEFWDNGVKIARQHYNNWDGDYRNKQAWPIGTYGLLSIRRFNYPTNNTYEVFKKDGIVLTNEYK